MTGRPDATTGGPRSQIGPICTPQPMSTWDIATAPNGGSARGYLELFAR
jgi:hypothetical protein